MKKVMAFTGAVLMAAMALTGCSKSSRSNGTKELIKVGYAQVGAESDWRLANTESFKSTFTKENGYDLNFVDAQQKQENQIKAIRDFIQQDVDYIVLAPVVESGWDTVLTEAKAANIPVILSDRLIKTADESLYVCWVGGNFVKESLDAVKWLDSYLEKIGRSKDQINIVDLQGTIGASAQIGRTEGIKQGVDARPNWHLVAQQSGDFTQDGGQTAMEAILKSIGADKIDVVFAENDNMAFGAIDAIKAAGKVPGKDIIIISYDAVHEAFERTIKGEINCLAECNPLHGPRVAQIIQTLEAGGSVDKIQYVDEGIFDQTNAAEILPNRQY